MISHGEPQNFLTSAMEFGKIFHGKLWTLLVIVFILGNAKSTDCI